MYRKRGRWLPGCSTTSCPSALVVMVDGTVTRELRVQNWKHSIRLPIEVRPSRGGAGGPEWPVAASLFLLGVWVSKVWLIEARVGSPNAASMNFSVKLCSYTVGSRWPGRAKGEMTHIGTRGPIP